MARLIRVGYIGGEASRINERVIDSQWTNYLGEYVELVKIPPLSILKCFGGSIDKWKEQFPTSLPQLSTRLKELTERYDIQAIYMNWTNIIPYILMARNTGKTDVSVLFITHCVGSESWLKQWLAIAPWLTKKDVLLTSTLTSKQALLNISEQYEYAFHVPLCIKVPYPSLDQVNKKREKTKTLFSIGRIEDVKNIDQLLISYAQIRKRVPDTKLVIAGEYTGFSEKQKVAYKDKISEIIQQNELQESVTFTGPIQGQQKEEIFKQADLLINVSTDPGETFGFNLIEAKTLGVPVVCTHWDGFAELVQHGKDGYLVDCQWDNEIPAFDQETFISYCVRLLQDDALRLQMSEQAIARAAKYDYQEIMPQVIQALHKGRSFSIDAEPLENVPDIASTRIKELTHIYHAKVRTHQDLNGYTPMNILLESNVTPVQKWMSKCKPFISHYAGRH